MRKLLLTIFALLIVPTFLCAEVKEYKLDNGLKVLIIEDHKAPIATFQIWYKVGSRNENLGKTGLSHLLEHMMFKGTPKYGSKAFSKIVQKNGGSDNAFTTKDYTMYFQTLSSDRIDISIELEADRMRNLVMDPKEVIAERNVVMEERRMRYEDDPQNMLYEEVVAGAFKSHPYQWPVIGWMADVSSIEKDDLYNYYRAYYSPDNAFIVVAGDVNPDKIIEKIKESFGSIVPVNDRKSVVAKEENQKGERRISLKRDAELPYFIAVYHTPNFSSEDSYALDLLAMILSGGKSSRFYKSLVYEKKLALSADADYSGFNIDPYLFMIAATAAPGKNIKDIESVLYSEIEMIIKKPPSDMEIQKAKNQIESSFIMGQDSIFYQGMITGQFEIMGSWKLKEKYLEGIRKVTAEDVMKTASKYLIEDNRTVGILIPTKTIGSEK
ncbi:MAG: insulinase family protein [Nitrospiraceae bacterium]|nr:insulinase family protein [Nitrospiraceae bacterium]